MKRNEGISHFVKGIAYCLKYALICVVPIYMFYQEQIGKHLFDIYLRKENRNVGTLLLLISGRWLVFMTIMACMMAELRTKAEEALCKDSEFVIQARRYRVASTEYLCPVLVDHKHKVITK